MVTIPVQGWSAALTTDWLLYPHVSQVTSSGAFDDVLDSGSVVVTSEAGIGTLASCYQRWAMNNGTGGSVQVTASASAVSGDYLVFRMDSFREDSTCYQPVTQDDFHFWPVGVYVP
jgi:hypothetical protein